MFYRRLLVWGLVFCVIGCAADFATTWFFVSHRSGIEAVWLSRWIIDHLGWTGFAVVKAAQAPLLYLLAPPLGIGVRWVGNLLRSPAARHPLVPADFVRLRAVAAVGLAALNFAAAVHNLEWIDFSWLFRLTGADV